MNRKAKILLLSVCMLLLSFSAKAQQSYIQNNKSHAQELSRQYGIPTSVMLAIAVVETGAGTSASSKALNNHFGIVGKNTVNSSRYRSFDSVKESYEAFCKLLQKKSYFEKLKGTADFQSWIAAIASAGYSTQPKVWMQRMLGIYQKMQLKNLD